MTIPASDVANVTPNVLAAGGSGLALNGLALTLSTRVPIGTVANFGSAPAVEAFFGGGSAEAAEADVYFLGFNGSNITPGAMLFAQYPQAAVAAYVRGGNVSALTLTQLKALTGTLTVVFDGYSRAGGSISLSAATSFSSAAGIIQTALNGSLPEEAAFTASMGAAFTASGSGTALTVSAVAYGIISVGDTVTGVGIPADTTIVSGPSNGGTGGYVTSQATTASTASCDALSNVLDVSALASGTIAVGQTVAGSGVTGAPVLTALGSGVGGTGTYVFSGAQQTIVPPESMTTTATAVAVAYDSTSGAFTITSGVAGVASTSAFPTGTLAGPIALTSAAGAVTSQGAAATDPVTFMDGLVQVNQNWVTLFTIFNPDAAPGTNTEKLLFSSWTDSRNNRFLYAGWDPDASPTVTLPATGSFGYEVTQAGYSGTSPIYEPGDTHLAAFLAGSVASIDFTQTDGRTTMAFRSQDGIPASVTSQTAAQNLAGNPQVDGSFGNGYNFYGAYATANEGFTFFQRGSVSGKYQWIDSYVDQIWMNSEFQLDMVLLLTQVKSIPYDAAGAALIEAALGDTIQQALNFGAIRSGVTLSSLQVAEVNTAAGANIAPTLQTRGWYLQVKPATPTTRVNRTSPPCTFWYTDGGSVQALQLASVEVQ